MERSLLLQKILLRCEKLQSRDSRYGLADYFFLEALNAARATSANMLKDYLSEIPDKAVETEAHTLLFLFEQRKIDVYKTYELVLNFIKKNTELKFASNADVWNALSKTAEEASQWNVLDVVTADVLLAALLQSPTVLVTAALNQSEAASEAASASSKPLSDLLNPIDDRLNVGKSNENLGGAFGRPRRAPETPFGAKKTTDDSLFAKSQPAAQPAEGGDWLKGFNVPSDSVAPENKPKKTVSGDESGKELLSQAIMRVKTAQDRLLDTVFGQDQAINTFVSGYFQSELTALTQDKRTRPRATFLFAGPPGVGKTFLAEQAAEQLSIPFKRFDMSEYSNKDANLDLCGSNKVWKDAKAGNLTDFVEKNPKCILLFDEIEKAHTNVIYLFLQLLDAGRLRDNYTDEEVSFVDTVVIFTTNAGKQLYEDPNIVNLSSVSKKAVLKALSSDINPVTGSPFFPAAICSRFASGNVVMFNHLGAHNLLKIVDRELEKHSSAFTKKTAINVEIDGYVPYAIMFSEGGKADARTVRGKTANFLYQEFYELFRLMASSKNEYDAKNLKEIRIEVELPKDEKIRSFFAEAQQSSVLIFANGKLKEECEKKLTDGVTVYYADTVEEAKEILFDNDISVILCDVCCKMKSETDVLNLEDADSVGKDFFEYVQERVSVPLYLIQENEDDISQEEFLSFSAGGARGLVTVNGYKDFKQAVVEKCNIAYQQKNLLELGKANKIIAYKTAQRVTDDGKKAIISLFDFELGLAMDAEDSKNVLSNVSKPDVRFGGVIGAEDAKAELKYFVEYLKNPVRFMRKGVRAPKGVLLYGPPGTGKTMLAKAMAGESDVTFITAEGNQFLKKFVGEGAEKVHELFNTARKYAPSILFIDEIDVIGKERKGAFGSDTSADVLTAFLTEMDGFKANTDKPVFVLAATNYDVDPDSNRALDSALLRRFDRKILVDLPNKSERAQYIRLKASVNKNLQISDEQIDNIAVRSTGMSLAELELVIELALRDAIKSEDFIVTDEIFENAFESYNSGEVKKWDESTLERTARHESGHALLCWLGGETPSYLTIVARGSHGGYMQHADHEGKGLYTKEELLARVRTSLGGRAAEIVYYGDKDGVSTGASGDLQSATRVVEQMICSYGMDEKIGLASVSLTDLASSEYATKIRNRVNEILKEQYEETIRIISENRVAIDKMVEVLMHNNHLKGNEIDELFKKYAKRN